MLGLHAAITYTNSRTAVANSLGTIFFLMVGILICAFLIILSDREFGRQLLSFLIFIGAGSVALFGSLGAKNPSRAIALVSLLTPFWSFYCIISLLNGDVHGRLPLQRRDLRLRPAGDARPRRQRLRHRPGPDQRHPGVDVQSVPRSDETAVASRDRRVPYFSRPTDCSTDDLLAGLLGSCALAWRRLGVAAGRG